MTLDINVLKVGEHVRLGIVGGFAVEGEVTGVNSGLAPHVIIQVTGNQHVYISLSEITEWTPLPINEYPVGTVFEDAACEIWKRLEKDRKWYRPGEAWGFNWEDLTEIASRPYRIIRLGLGE